MVFCIIFIIMYFDTNGRRSVDEPWDARLLPFLIPLKDFDLCKFDDVMMLHMLSTRVCIRIHNYTRTHIHTHTHAHERTHIHTHTHTHSHKHAHTHTHTLINHGLLSGHEMPGSMMMLHMHQFPGPMGVAGGDMSAMSNSEFQQQPGASHHQHQPRGGRGGGSAPGSNPHQYMKQQERAAGVADQINASHYQVARDTTSRNYSSSLLEVCIANVLEL